MKKKETLRDDLDLFSNKLNNKKSTALYPELMTENTVLEILLGAVSSLGVNSILFSNNSLLTYLDHREADNFSVPTSQKNALESALKQFEARIQYGAETTYYLTQEFNAQYAAAANEDKIPISYVLSVVYGPNGRSGKFLFALDATVAKPTEEQLVNVQHYAQIAFLKINQMIIRYDNKAKLTPREKDIVKLIAKGRSNPEVAEITGLSVHTVNGYLRGVYLKTHTKDRVSLSFYALHKGLLL